MTTRVAVAPEMVRWARERAEESLESLSKPFPRIADWETGEVQPTFKQLEQFARRTHVPLGYLFLPQPPEEEVPIPDLRTVGSRFLDRPSPDLLDTIYLCQRRQAWYREWARSVGEESKSFLGSVTTRDSAMKVAAEMREALDFDLEERRECRTWEEALRRFIAQAEDLGVLVMVSGVVGSNNHRPLDPEEFRGFALADPLAPLVFINGKDTKSAQMFTLAHELAHLWLGQSALTDAGPASTPERRVEVWCNAVAAELLVPLASLQEVRGDSYPTQALRVSRRFARAVIASTLEGKTLYRHAFQLLGVRKPLTFREMGDRLGWKTA